MTKKIFLTTLLVATGLLVLGLTFMFGSTPVKAAPLNYNSSHPSYQLQCFTGYHCEVFFDGTEFCAPHAECF